MNSSTRKQWPLFSTLGVYWVTIIVLVVLSISRNQGYLVYPLDDTYIHMSMAKNAVLDHVWGVTRYEFTSSTSSPLWTFLLAVTYLVFGVNQIAPLLLNLIFGSLLIFVAYIFLSRFIDNRRRIFILLAMAVFVAPLPTVTFAGMEHVLHALLSLYFVYLSVSVLSGPAKPVQRNYVQLMFLAPLVIMVRYEGLFLVFVVCVLFLLQKKIFTAAILGITGLLPMIMYGLWSVAHGWYFLPTSVLLKGYRFDYSVTGIIRLMGYDAFRALLTLRNLHMLFLLVVSLVLLLVFYFKKEKTFEREKTRAVMIFVGTLLLHMQYAATGWLFRYEAYLVFLGMVAIGVAADDLLSQRRRWSFKTRQLPYYSAVILLTGVIAVPFGYRTVFSLIRAPRAAKNIYEQQYQMGLFFRKFYQGKAVAVNDIGAVTYLADVRLLDLWGLASLEPARMKMQKKYTFNEICDLSQKQGVTVAIVYDSWFQREEIGGLPQEWVKVGQWKLSDNAVWGKTVSLYAVDASASDELMQNLREFAPELPGDVRQYGAYTEK